MAETPEPDRELSGDEAGQALSKALDVVLRGGQRGGKSAALDLEAMKVRCNAATVGPWHQGPHYRSDVESRCGRICETKLNTPQGIANAEFIAHARMDVPNLIREIEGQRAEMPAPTLERLRELAGPSVDGMMSILVRGGICEAHDGFYRQQLREMLASYGEMLFVNFPRAAK